MGGLRYHLGCLSELLGGLSQPLAALSQPLGGLCWPLQVLSQPLASLSQPLAGLSYPDFYAIFLEFGQRLDKDIDCPYLEACAHEKLIACETADESQF